MRTRRRCSGPSWPGRARPPDRAWRLGRGRAGRLGGRRGGGAAAAVRAALAGRSRVYLLDRQHAARGVLGGEPGRRRRWLATARSRPWQASPAAPGRATVHCPVARRSARRTATCSAASDHVAAGCSVLQHRPRSRLRPDRGLAPPTRSSLTLSHGVDFPPSIETSLPGRRACLRRGRPRRLAVADDRRGLGRPPAPGAGPGQRRRGQNGARHPPRLLAPDRRGGVPFDLAPL